MTVVIDASLLVSLAANGLTRLVAGRALPADSSHTTSWWPRRCARRQAEAFGQPWVTSRPWATLPDRLIQAWKGPIRKQRGAPLTT